jgi:pyridoxal phosphate enzyme (YggS family)
MGYDVAINLSRIKLEIGSACASIGRNPDDIILIGVTKYFSFNAIVAAVQAGVAHIGENRVMEVRDKFPAADAELETTLGPGRHYKRHLIGHLQRNKVRVALENFDMIQTLDSVHLAEEIQKEAVKMNIGPFECLIEIKVSDEKFKTGINPDGLKEIVSSVKGLDRINVLGIMGMPPYFADPDDARPYFRTLREAYESLKPEEDDRLRMKYLSMGMSHDYPVAIEEGANMVRIGQALFK